MKRNPVAKSLRSPHLAPKRIPSKKVYTRKGRTAKGVPSSFLVL